MKRDAQHNQNIKTWIRARDSRLKPLTFNRWPRQGRKMEVKICFIHQMCWSVFDCFTVGDLFYFLYVFMFDLNFASRMTPACPAFLHGWDHIAQIARLFGFFTQVLWNACCGKFWNVGGRWNIGCMLEYIGEYSNTLLAVLWFAWFLLKWVCCVFFGREYD